MLVVTTPTGQIGRHVLARLADAGEPVRAIARDPGRIDPDRRGQVEVVAGSHGDAATLARALEGAEGVFWCIPPDYAAPDAREYYLGYARVLAEALPGSSVRRVVFVSSGGRGRSARAGVVGISHEVEGLLEATGVGVRSLRCGTFMENMLRLVGPIRHAGVFGNPVAGDVPVPLVAVADIGAVAADLSYDEMAATMARVLGRPVRYRQVPAAEFVAQGVEHGMSPSMAQGLADMFREVNAGLYAADPRTPESTTPTTFEAWCRAHLVPAMG